jgi:protein-disulfide isomerase
MRPYSPFLLIAGGLALGLAAGFFLFLATRLDPDEDPRGIGNLAQARPGAEPPHVRGNPDAPVTLEEFTDFECAVCGKHYQTLRQLEGEYGSRVRFIFREFPMIADHHRALEAARAAEAAARQGRFWEMHDHLFENGQDWARTVVPRLSFVKYAKALGLDASRFEADLDNRAIYDRILADLDRGKSIKINATPAIFIDARLVPPRLMTYEGMRKLIEAALREKGISPP